MSTRLPRKPPAPGRFDARAWRRFAVSFLLFGGVGLIVAFGGAALGLKHGGEALQRWLGAGLTGPWAPLAALAGFVALAFLGLPQFVLVAAEVAAYGAVAGFGYSFVGNLVSAVLGFYVGRRFGATLLHDHAGAGVRDFMAMVGRNGFRASALVRLVPSAPFVVVNMAAGVTPMRLSSFVGGTALGSLPKIALTAFAGEQALQLLRGGGAARGWGIALAAAIWIGSALWARGWMRRRRGATASPPHTP